MSRTIYALFVGIDAYPAPVNQLNGCVNDVTRLHDLLQTRVTGGSDRFAPVLLTNEKATRQGIIDGWRGHLGQARKGDVALVYYSGHDSQEQAPQEFWDLEPDHMNETLVCFDSRLPGGWDLADKELAQLIAEVAANEPHIAIVLDCCHAGSGTRSSEEVTARQEKAHEGTRPIETYIVTPEQALALASARPAGSTPAMPLASIAAGRHILLAACRPEETAKETFFRTDSGMEKRGAFSYYIEETLKSGSALSYRDLFKRVGALVQTKVRDQSPQLEATHPEDAAQSFLGGAIPATPSYFTLSDDPGLGWVVDAGAVHGMPQPVDGGESTQLAIFPFDADLASLRSLEHAIGQATVTGVFPGQSGVTPVRFDGAPLAGGTTYKAIVTSTPLPPLAVVFEGDQAALELVRQALATTNLDGTPSLLVRESDLLQADYRLLAADDRYRICRKADAWMLAVDTPDFTSASAQLAAQRLEHIARWVTAARLANPATELASTAVQIDVFRERDGGELEPLDTTSGLRLEYEQADGQRRAPHLQIRLRNTTTDQRLFCMLLDLPESYSIYTGLLPRGGVWLDPGEETWATVLVRGRLRKTIDLFIPDELWRQGVTEQRDILKLIISTDEADATLMQQDDLPLTVLRSVQQRDMPRGLNTLNRLMARVHTRNVGAASGNNEAFTDWTTVQVVTTVVRPAEAAIAT